MRETAECQTSSAGTRPASAAEMTHGWTTDAGVAVPSVTAAQMREIDRIAIETTGPNLFQMMENAGRSLAALVLQHLGEGWRRGNVLVLAGPGGNGGGGICAARHLANRGIRVDLYESDPGRSTPTTGYQRHIFRATSGRTLPADGLPQAQPDLIVDALIGYGLRGAAAGSAGRLIEWANARACPIVALDVPSGLDATTGDASGPAIRATMTMTLALPKTGLHPTTSGHLVLADLGIPDAVYRQLGLSIQSPFDHRFAIPLHWSEEGKHAHRS